MKTYLKSDYMLYNHFYRIIENKSKQLGQERIVSELDNLSKVNADIAKVCSVTAADNSALRCESAWWGPGLVGYNVTP